MWNYFGWVFDGWFVKANANQLLTSVVPALNDSLLQHNREMTAYISQLSTERQGLLLNNAELQQKLSALQHAADTRTQQVLSVCLLLVIIMVWLVFIISFIATMSVLIAFDRWTWVMWLLLSFLLPFVQMKTLGISDIYRLDDFPVAYPTVSEHWMNHLFYSLLL